MLVTLQNFFRPKPPKQASQASHAPQASQASQASQALHAPQRTVRVWRSEFFGSRVNTKKCNVVRYDVCGAAKENLPQMCVYHWVSHRRPSTKLNSPSVAMMLESEPNYGLIKITNPRDLTTARVQIHVQIL